MALDPEMEPQITWSFGVPIELMQRAIGVEVVTIAAGAAAVGFAKRPTNARIALVSVEGAAVRYSETGDQISASIGLLIPIGTLFRIYGEGALQSAQFTSGAAGTTVLNVIYYSVVSPSLEEVLRIYPGLP